MLKLIIIIFSILPCFPVWAGIAGVLDHIPSFKNGIYPSDIYLRSNLLFKGQPLTAKNNQSKKTAGYQWFSAELPQECQEEDCHITIETGLQTSVACYPASGCEVCSATDRQLTLKGIRTGTVLALNSTPDFPDHPPRYILFKPSDATSSPPQGQNHWQLPLKIVAFSSTRVEPVRLQPATPALFCEGEHIYLGTKDFQEENDQVRLWTPPEHSPPTDLMAKSVHCQPDQTNLNELEILFDQLQLSETAIKGLSLHKEDPNRKLVSAYRRAYDSARGEISTYVYVNGQWQLADGTTIGAAQALEDNEKLYGLSTIETGEAYGYNTPHNSRYRQTMDRLRREDSQKYRNNKPFPLKGKQPKGRQAPPPSPSPSPSPSPASPVPERGSNSGEADLVTPMQETQMQNSETGNDKFQQQEAAPESEPTSEKHQQQTPLNDLGMEVDMEMEMEIEMDQTSEASSPPLHTFGTIHISPDGQTFTRNETDQGNACVILNTEISQGKHRWAFMVKCDYCASLCVGLVRKGFSLAPEYLDIPPDKKIFQHQDTLLYRSYQGSFYIDGQEKKTFPKFDWFRYGSGELICEVDMTAGTLSFAIRNKKLIVAARDLSGQTYHPVLCFYGSYEKAVRLLYYKTLTPLLLGSSRVDMVNKPAMDEIPAIFDSQNKIGNAKLSEDCKTLFRDAEKGKEKIPDNSLCLLNYRILKQQPGQYHFCFCIESDKGASLCIGVTPEESIDKITIPTPDYIFNSKELYCFRSFQGQIYCKGQEIGQTDEFWMDNTLVRLVLTVSQSNAKMELVINDQNQRVFLGKLPLPLTPFVGFYACKKKRCRLLDSWHSPTETEPGIQQRLLPIIARDHDTAAYYPACMICGHPTDTIMLPCEHSYSCHVHAVEHKDSNKCLICSAVIEGVWNILVSTNQEANSSDSDSDSAPNSKTAF